MIHIPAFSLTGTADFSSIRTELQNLEKTIGSLRVPPIKTDVATPNFSNFFSAIDKAEKQATIKIKPEVDNSFMGGLSNSLSGQKGKFSNVGKELGSSLTMGMQQQFGMAGGVATSLAGSFGAIGIAAVAGGAALIGLGAASTQAAMKWEDMKTSIGRTTGLKGDNLEDLMSQLQDLRQEFGVTAEAASSMVEQAGSIGVGQAKLNVGDVAGYKQEILDFTKATAILQGAWGMSAEATSSGIGKMGSVTLGAWNIQRKARDEEELSWADYAYKVGGITDNLANAMGSSEEEIVTAMRNSSGAIAKWAPSEDTYGKWQAMASFLIDTGSSAGEAGTQIERVAQKLDQNSADVAKVMGIDQATLSTNLKTDFMGTVQDLGEAIAAMPASSRPDTAKMFGLEGKVLIDKVVADIEAGTGKLQGAYDLALKPGNVAEGYKDVADNASKAFDRIGQAFQVSLEKIGGQLLPIVADVANGIADAWVSANEIGTEAFTSVQSRVSTADQTIAETGSIVEWGKALLGIGAEAEPVIKDALESGAKDGVSDGIKKGTEAAAADAGKILAEEFSKAQDEYIKSHSSGGYSKELMAMLAANGSVDTGARYLYGIQNTKLDQTNYAALQNYTLNRSARSTDVGGILQILDSSGSIIKAESYTSEAEFRRLSKSLKEAIKPGFLEIPSYLSGVRSDVSDELEAALSDGVIEFTEKNKLLEYFDQLTAIQTEFPVEFEAAGLEKIKAMLTQAASNIPISFKKEELETNFALWLSQNAEEYQKIYESTGKRRMPFESEERTLWDTLQKSSKRGQELFAYIDKAATSGNYQDIELLPEVIAELGKVDPELLSLEGTTMRLDAAQQSYAKQVQQMGSKFAVLDDKSNQLAVAHLRTSTASDILSGGLLRAASAAAQWAAWSPPSTSIISNPTGSFWDGSKQSLSDGFNFPSKTAKYNPLSMSSPFYGLDTLPKLATGGKVTSGGLAWVGEAETEYVIPESKIRGLYPESAKIDMGSINYKPFLDYPAPEIRSPSSYRWSHYPDAPNVSEINTEGIQTAWLADNQLNSRDIYSGLIRQMQLANIGNSLVQPWFARGEIEQPKWWSDAATKLSPRYKENWEASKGGTVPSISTDVAATTGVADIAAKNGITVADAWSQLYGESFTEGCIGANAPDASLQFTPSASLIAEIGRTWGADTAAAWNQLYGEAFTEGCIGTNKPDSLLKYTPSASMLAEAARAQGGAWGSQLVGSSTGIGSNDKLITLSSDALSIAKKQLDISENIAQNTNKLDILSTGIFETQGALTKFPTISGSTMPGDALVTGLSKEGYLATYDPRTDTCEGLSFVAPDASLKTTDKFYLGLTQNSPFYSDDKASGYGWENVATPMSESDAQLMKIAEQSYKEQQQTQKDTAKIEQNTKDMATGLGTMSSGNISGGILGALVAMYGAGGGSGALNSRGAFGGSYGSLFGDWYGGGAAGLSSYLGTGSSASWMNAAATSIGGSGAIQWAEGGITDQPVFGVFGEAGREAFVPISDRAAGLRILPQVMRELGVRTFAQGGIVGSGSPIVATGYKFGDTPIVYAPVINGVGMGMEELTMVLERDHRKFLKSVAKKNILARRRRG